MECKDCLFFSYLADEKKCGHCNNVNSAFYFIDRGWELVILDSYAACGLIEKADNANNPDQPQS